MALRTYGKVAIQEFVDNGTEFSHGTIKGKKYDSWDDVPKGRLAHGHDDIINYNEVWRDRQVSVIFSYNTPIAWKFDGEADWSIPEIRHSVTTTNHQNVTRVAVHNPEFYKATSRHHLW